MDLIGDLQKEEFYNKLRERCDENFNKGEEIILTKTQIIEVVLELKFKELPVKDLKIDMVIEVDKLFEKTKFGLIGLN
jgi:glyceraldehyde-3-phosphate dehydrogenase/erythrose-4-phosphate dehydrogenase